MTNGKINYSWFQKIKWFVYWFNKHWKVRIRFCQLWKKVWGHNFFMREKEIAYRKSRGYLKEVEFLVVIKKEKKIHVRFWHWNFNGVTKLYKIFREALICLELLRLKYQDPTFRSFQVCLHLFFQMSSGIAQFMACCILLSQTIIEKKLTFYKLVW